MLNRVILIGYVGKDGVDLRYTPNGRAVASFSLGVRRPFKNQGKHEWDNVPIVVWGNQAENCANYLNKGSLCAVDGRLQIRSYEGQDGQRRWITEVVADTVRFLTPKASEPGNDMGEQVAFNPDDVPF